MDIQSLALISRIERERTTFAHKSAIASIKATTSKLCIERALSVLDAFGYYNDVIYLWKQKWQICDLSVEEYFPDLTGRMANETPVFWFWGGPPNKLKWYRGTLQTLLDDRIMFEIHERGVSKVAKLIGLDLEGLANVSASIAAASN
ncbi:MAG: hypothetical protein ACYSUB_01760 [Planctomycetota bacterium]|jgi:hypothetical protein